MQEVNRDQVIDILKNLGVAPGDGLLVHSAVQFLGWPVGGVRMYSEAILAVIGPNGTLVVPTFNFGFARGERYDPQETPSVGMGAFSEFVRRLPDARRTSHPMQSIAAVGRYATDLAGRDTLSAFDPGSAFERMLELDFKLLLLGADERAVSMFHYSEQRASVPYRYWKDFTGEVHTPEGWQVKTYRMFVARPGAEPPADARAGGGSLAGARRVAQPAAPLRLDYRLQAARFCCRRRQLPRTDPWCLVTNRPKSSARKLRAYPYLCQRCSN